MKTSLLVLLMFLLGYTSAHCQDNLKNKLPELEKSIKLDSGFQIKPLSISRKDVWATLILPMERIAKGNIEEDFPIDSASIVQYEQWENVDLEKNDDFIEFYSPIFSGELYAIGKRSFKNGLTAILWGFRQKDFIYGNGDIVWLVLYDREQKVIDYKRVYENLTGGTPIDSFTTYTSSELNNQVVKIRTLIKESGKRKKEKTITYTISDVGIKEK